MPIDLKRLLVFFLGFLTFAGFAGAADSPAPAPEYEWIRVTPNALFPHRDGAGALVFRDRMWLIGGWNPYDKAAYPRTCSNDVWSSADGATWTLEKPNTFLDDRFDPAADWEGRHSAGYVVHRGRMWIVGGDPIQRHYQADVWSSADGRTWTQANPGRPVPWVPRVLHYTCIFHDKIWVMGGQTLPPLAPGEEKFYHDIWNSADGVNWTEVKPREPSWSARGIICGQAVFKDRIWILGGGIYETPNFPERRSYNEVWSSPDGVNWTCDLAQAPWAPRTYHNVAVFDDRLWVMSGFLEQGPGRSGNRNDVWSSPDGVHWTEVPGTPWKIRHAASVFVYDQALWVVAGKNMESDVWKLVRKK